MRWFWLSILFLILLTAGLYSMRMNNAKSQDNAIQPTTKNQSRDDDHSRRTQQPKDELRVNRRAQSDDQVLKKNKQNETPKKEYSGNQLLDLIDQSNKSQPVTNNSTVDSEIDTETLQVTEQFDHSSSVDDLIDALQEASSGYEAPRVQRNKPNPEIQPQRNESVQQVIESHEEDSNETAIDSDSDQETSPSYELRSDGSFFVLETQSSVVGEGTHDFPYEVDWNTLRSVSRSYNPKEGQDELPDWLDLLNGKQVRITGNTLVPVIATTTRELLVMQNPWDGCCIGIPPSPYDAIEVYLNHDVDFGSSAVGYGTVNGTFILDPYVVDGWVLGLYIIEDASYRSGEGIAFPDF